jgi:hypothetical protein
LKVWPAVLRIRDVYPGSRILIFTHPGSRIPDPKTATKERGEKKFGPIFKELLNLLPKKLSLSSQKYGLGIRDPGSRKNLFRIPDPGVKKAPDPGSGSATLLARIRIRIGLASCIQIRIRTEINKPDPDTH